MKSQPAPNPYIVSLALFALIVAGPMLFASHRDFSTMPVRAGRISVALLELSKDVTFTAPMSGTNYSITLTSSSGMAAAGLTYSTKTATGFTIVISTSVAGLIDYTATLHQ